MIRVINLDKDKVRLEHISDNLNNLDLNWSRFSAIYGKNLTDQEIEKHTTPICRNLTCTKGIIGCAMSHILAWKEFIEESDEEFLIVFEDDSDVQPQFKEFYNKLPDIYDELDFDHISLYCDYGLCDERNVGIKKPKFPLSTAAYVLSRKGAKKLLKYFTKENGSCDVFYHIDFAIALYRLQSDYKLYYFDNLVKLHSDSWDSSLAVYKPTFINWTLRTLHLKNVIWYLNVVAFSIRTTITFTWLSIFLLIALVILCIYCPQNKILIGFVLVELLLNLKN